MPPTILPPTLCHRHNHKSFNKPLSGSSKQARLPPALPCTSLPPPTCRCPSPSNCNEDFASLIEIMIHRTSTPASVVALVSRSRVQLMQQKQPKLQLQLQPPKSASKTSWRCLTFTDASECDEEVRKVLYSIRYLVSCSCAVPELVEKKARALLEAKQTEAAAQLAPDAPNSPPLQLPAVALRHQRKQQQLTAGSVPRLVASPRRRGSPHQ